MPTDLAATASRAPYLLPQPALEQLASLPVPVPAPVSGQPTLEHWLDTVTTATTDVLHGLAGSTREGDTSLALLQAIDGATQAMANEPEASSALRHGLTAALQTARAASIAAQARDGAEQRHTARDALITRIAEIEKQVAGAYGNLGVQTARGALSMLVAPLSKLDPALGRAAKAAVDADSCWVGYYLGSLAALRAALAACDLNSTSRALVLVAPEAKRHWLARLLRL